MSHAAQASPVAILGASKKEERYAYLAQKSLMEQGYRALPISNSGTDVLGVSGYKSLNDITEAVDTVTLYVNPTILVQQFDALLRLHPRRVIFNPGTESAELQARLTAAGIHVVEACTLVLLRIGQFETA